ncbi:MAG: response regulator transcription factor [Bacteroidia bacterium]|nr:response regulator transcription factor [Bacteroidia bacterium]
MKKTIQALVIDDEYRARKTLTHMLTTWFDDVQVVAEAETVEEGVNLITQHQPDLVFLDIHMPTGSGFSLFQNYVLPPFEVIFVTADKEHAIQAMRHNALDYLLKPIDPEELEKAIERFRTRVRTAEKPMESTSRIESPPKMVETRAPASFDKMVLPTREGFILINLENILHCEASGNYTIFHLTDGRQIVATRNLKVFDQQFAEHHFHRVHHKDLVNLAHVVKVNSKEGFLTLTNGKTVEISARKKAGLIKRLRDG